MQINNEQLETRRASNDNCRLPLPPASCCFQCALHVRATDRFCRHCGAVQTMRTEGLETTASLAATSGLRAASRYATAPLLAEEQHRVISGPLIQSVTGRLAARKTARFTSRWSRGVLLALISVPVWLMIVLLSPFDAYVAARATVEGK